MLTGTWIINIDMTVSDAGQHYMIHKISSRGAGNLVPTNVHTVNLLSERTINHYQYYSALLQTYANNFEGAGYNYSH